MQLYAAPPCTPGRDSSGGFRLQGRSLVHLAAMSGTLVPLEFVHRRLLMDVAFAEVRKACFARGCCRRSRGEEGLAGE